MPGRGCSGCSGRNTASLRRMESARPATKQSIPAVRPGSMETLDVWRRCGLLAGGREGHADRGEELLAVEVLRLLAGRVDLLEASAVVAEVSEIDEFSDWAAARSVEPLVTGDTGAPSSVAMPLASVLAATAGAVSAGSLQASCVGSDFDFLAVRDGAFSAARRKRALSCARCTRVPRYGGRCRWTLRPEHRGRYRRHRCRCQPASRPVPSPRRRKLRR